MWRRVFIAVLILVLIPIAFLFLWPVSIEPVAWEQPKAPELKGLLSPNNALVGANHLLEGIGIGPEDIAFDEHGNLYCGFEGGMIVSLPAGRNEARIIANTNGRPLGMVFNKYGDLIVADAFKGLISVTQNGEITVLTTKAGDVPINFADDLDIGPNGSIYVSDVSTKYSYGMDIPQLIEHSGTGRLIRYDPNSNKTEVLVDGLQFANGVTVAKDGSFVLVAETGAYRIRRLWLKGPRQGHLEIFADNLPGFPDNINLTDRGTVLVALPTLRWEQLDNNASKPFFRKVLFRYLLASTIVSLPGSAPARYGLVVELSPDGNILRSFHDPTGNVAFVTSAIERQGLLYLGSNIEQSVAVVSIQ